MKLNLNPEDAALDAAHAMFQIEGLTCYDCKHLHGDKLTCKAFPQGIPQRFIGAIKAHTSPADGDHGIQFEAK